MTKCYYCEEESAEDQKHWSKHEWYYVTEKTILPAGFKYETKMVSIPRCTSCHKKQNKALAILLGAFMLSFTASFLILWYTVITDVVAAIVISLIISGLATFVVNMIFQDVVMKKMYGIKHQDSIEDYPLIQDMLKEGWVRKKPNASTARTGEQTSKDRDI